jgi:hypothetical protein
VLLRAPAARALPFVSASSSRRPYRALRPLALATVTLLATLLLRHVLPSPACDKDNAVDPLQRPPLATTPQLLTRLASCLARPASRPNNNLRSVRVPPGPDQGSVRRVLGLGNAALDELDLSVDAAAALERLVDGTWRLILRSGSLLVAAEKALPAAIVRQAHVGGLEEQVRNFIATSQASGAFRVGPIG